MGIGLCRGRTDAWTMVSVKWATCMGTTFCKGVPIAWELDPVKVGQAHGNWFL